MAFTTKAGNKFAASMTEWLQDTRLLSEAAYRLYADHRKHHTVIFSNHSWPKRPKGDKTPPMQPFHIGQQSLSERTASLSKSLWRSRFVFLETLWEEYLHDLVLELRHKDASVFEPFCEKEFMAGIVRDVLADNLQSVDEIKDEAATRFATGITRQSWKDQWRQLEKLEIGLSKNPADLLWFSDVEIYFEMRNCVIHQQGRVSSLLKKKSEYYRDKGKTHVEVWPQHLDFYRGRFLDAVSYIEQKVEAKFAATSST